MKLGEYSTVSVEPRRRPLPPMKVTTVFVGFPSPGTTAGATCVPGRGERVRWRRSYLERMRAHGYGRWYEEQVGAAGVVLGTAAVDADGVADLVVQWDDGEVGQVPPGRLERT